MTLMILNNKYQKPVAKFGGQVDWSTEKLDQSTIAEYLKQVRDAQQEGLVYRAFIVKHKTKRGYSPKSIKYRKLFGYYKSEMEIKDGVITIHNYIRPLPIADEITIKEVLNEGTKTV